MERVKLTPELEAKVRETERRLKELLQQEKPPPARRIPACRACAYLEFCFAEEEDA
ncbi:CRISPR-associated protein Cas4 [Thermus sp. CCB_US3_UF1]|nr:CRISPR-associated protein Cas4 [Thermus sp. CCB_US3_UF1]